MKRSSHQAYHVQRLAILSILTLSILFLVSSSKPSAAQKVAQAGWRVEVKEGQSVRSTLTINNRCSEPHLFRIKSKAKYLHFEQLTDSVLIAAGSNKQLGVRFDATGLKSKVYQSKVVIDCIDCKESKCTQDRDELPVELAVLVPNIYSWCVETTFVTEGKMPKIVGKCKVVSVFPNYSKNRCDAPRFLTIPNDGRPVPKVGSFLPVVSCLQPGPKPVLNPDLKLTTYWNGDPPDTTCITVKVVDVYGSNKGPIANALVEAKGVYYNNTTSSGYTNSQGLVCLRVKINAPIVISAYDPAYPAAPIYSSNITSPNVIAGAADCGDPVKCPLVETFEQDAE